MLIVASGSHPYVEHQDRPLDLDQGLLICHPDMEDEVKGYSKILYIRGLVSSLGLALF